ncbi:MAG: LysR family transcriptional regulator, partial [Oscillospiraceae bacterium]
TEVSNNKMNFDQIKIFISVVEQGSFTRAAEKLYISHSTTSRCVSALEDELDVRLLLRDNRSVQPTLAGEILCREGRLLLQMAEELTASVQSAERDRQVALALAGGEKQG